MPVAPIDPDRLLQAVRAVFLVADDRPPRFLARGEYSLNYLVDGANGSAVVRLVTGSQIGLALPEQVRYEARALELLAPSGRTPRLLAVGLEAGDVPYPFLVESYLPGRPLDYATDLASAAVCLAAIHAVLVPAEHGLQVHRDPGPSIVAESRDWAEAYLGWDGASAASRRMLEQAIAVVEADLDRAAEVFAEPDLVLVNYDVNTHNFIVHDDGFVSLVDWE
ncbi:MAG: aminoglycoside phosphotransferase family protein, partial [Chloroflexota bacterium]|nr:aminoglycoside phosphotransferase family protein [Chloroflexota bacterium]